MPTLSAQPHFWTSEIAWTLHWNASEFPQTPKGRSLIIYHALLIKSRLRKQAVGSAAKIEPTSAAASECHFCCTMRNNNIFCNAYRCGTDVQLPFTDSDSDSDSNPDSDSEHRFCSLLLPPPLALSLLMPSVVLR